MKRFKWAALVAAMVSMVGFTSCLNNDDDGTRTTLGYFRAVGNYGAVYFQDMYDFKYQPTTSLMDSPTSELAFLYFTYNQNDITQGATSIDITLLQNPTYLKRLYVGTTLPDEKETVSLVDLSSANGGIWGVNEFLVLSPTYLLKSGTTDENLTEELANHRLEVYYDANENTNTSTLTLNLRYTISGATAPEEGSDAEHWADEYTVPYTDAVYVRLSDVISKYQVNNSGNDPEKIVVEYEDYNGSGSVPTMDPDKKLSRTISYDWVKVSDDQ